MSIRQTILAAAFSLAALPGAVCAQPPAAAGAKVTPLLTKPLAGIDGKEGLMVTAMIHTYQGCKQQDCKAAVTGELITGTMSHMGLKGGCKLAARRLSRMDYPWDVSGQSM